jgi:internalin A
MKNLGGVLAFAAVGLIAVSGQGCAKIKDLINQANQPQQPTNVRPAQDYAFSNSFCEHADQLPQASKATVQAIDSQTDAGLASSGTSIEKIRGERKAAGDDRTHCQILEDVVEYGADYARGQNVNGSASTGLTLTNLTAIDLNVVASLSVASLNLNNDQVFDLSPLSRMSRLVQLGLQNIPFTDLTPVQALSGLKTLVLDGCTGVRDIAPLTRLEAISSLTLRDMHLAGSASGYYPLKAMKNLKKLDLGGSDVPSTSVLPDAQLEELFVDAQSFGDADLAQITALYPAIKRLTFASPALRDLTPLAGAVSATLEYLGIPAGQYTSLGVLTGFPRLAGLNVRALTQADFMTLAGLPALTSLQVQAPVSQAADLDAFRALQRMTSLQIAYVGDLAGLDAFASLPALQQLTFTDYGGRLGSLAAVGSMPNLRAISINWAKLQDITPLYSFLDSRAGSSVTLTGCELPRAQESLHNTLTSRYGSRYNAINITWR